MITLLLVLALSYLLGSIPTSILAGRLMSGVDIRQHGSKNAGATNVYRVLGLGPAIVVAAIDVGKGAAAALLLSRIQVGGPAPVDTMHLQLLAGGAAVIGHIWPLFAGFRGGKGVATTIGVLVGIAPVALAAALAVWLVLLFTSRIMSMASLAAAVVLPISTWIWESNPDGSVSSELLGFTMIICVLIFFTHRSNIRRLLRGEELTIGRNRDQEVPPPPAETVPPKVRERITQEIAERIDRETAGQDTQEPVERKAAARKDTR